MADEPQSGHGKDNLIPGVKYVIAVSQGRAARCGYLWSEHSHDDGRDQAPGTERR
jgi:hypothetical protein